MRKAIIFVFIVALVAGLTTLATAQTKFGELLWELETSVKWSSHLQTGEAEEVHGDQK